MVSTHLDFALQELARLELDPWLTNTMRVKLYNLQMELRFLKMFFRCYESWNYASNKDVHLGSFMSGIDVTLQEIVGDYGNWETSANQLLEKVEHFKPEMKEICFDLLDSTVLRCKASTSDEIYDFIVTIYQNLKDFLGSKVHMIVAVKEQIEALQKKLKLFGNLVFFSAERCICYDEELRDFLVEVQAWTNKVASLLFLYWVDQLEEETVPKLDAICLEVLQQIKPRSPEAIRKFLGVLKASKSSRSDTLHMCICFPVAIRKFPGVPKVLLGICSPETIRKFPGVLKASKSSRSEIFLMGELVASCVDMLLEDPMASMEDSFKTPLRDGLIILITFLVDPPTKYGKDGNEIWAKADVVVDEAASLISSLRFHEEERGIPNERDFLEKINILKAEIRDNYVQIQDLPWSDFPRTNGLGFVDFLLGNLKEMASSILFAKYLVLAIQEKLISLRPHLKDLVEQQNESEELKDLQMRIISVAYAVEHVVDSCFFEDNQIWYKMIRLSIFLKETEFVMTELEKIRDESVYNSRVSVEVNSSNAIPKYAKSSRTDEAVVGFQNETTTIIDQLTRGSKQLAIVSIVGMAGQGKTTLANKVYNDPSIIYNFNKLAWCFVSQVYQRKELLLDILGDVTVLDDNIRKMSEHELAENLYRYLKGQRYLIILDDIWDIEVWNQLKESFPNDNNGSRIMFTSRIHSIASNAELGSSTHLLHRLSADESWKLLQKKLFDEDSCPAYLLEVGLQIVDICEGLPLSIVVISGVLARRVQDLNWWKEIATNVSSKIRGEGCMDILELSYKHLPNILKTCFLYFGVFQQGKVVKVQKLTQLWVAEGFIPKTGTKRLEDMAMNFLMDLIERSLVIVVKRSSNGRIKECRVHDLLFDLCLTKIEQERFLKLLTNSQYPSNVKYEQYRLIIHTEWSSFVKSNPTALYARTLLIPQLLHWNHHPNAPSFFMKFKFLRVLDLENGVFFDGFPEEIVSLIHLRYLAIRGISSLPPNIENLQNLEVLCVHSSMQIIMVPATIWKMKRLRHICLRRITHFSFGNSVLEVAQLNNVDTLSWPFLCRNEYAEELLRRFPKVRKLRFRLWDHQIDCRQFPVLDFLINLESLNVLCPNRMHYPCDFKFPSTLKKLTLSGSGLPWSEISAVGKLPNLEVLKLLDDAFVGHRWEMEDEEFLKLKFLKLECSNIQQWNACADPFPCLQRLVLGECYELDEIPSDFGQISTLNLIDLRNCSNGVESSAREILNEQQDMGNDGFEVLIKSSKLFHDEDW